MFEAESFGDLPIHEKILVVIGASISIAISTAVTIGIAIVVLYMLLHS